MNISGIPNTVFLLKSLSNEQIYTESSQLFIQHIVSACSNGQIVEQPKLMLVK